MHSISDLTTFCRKTTGDVPAKLVGASTTVVGSKMYLFGGRLVTERRMVSDLYVFDLETFNWERMIPFPEDDVPGARYFHSADTWNNQLIIFGGMGNKFDAAGPEDLCVLNDIRFFDLSSRHWLPASSSNGTPSDSAASDSLLPKARYAHLSSVTADRLFIIGGQDLSNIWLDDVYVYDLLGKAWVQRRDYPRHCGTYRSVAVSANMRVRLPQDELRDAPSTLGAPGTRFRPDRNPPSTPDFTSSESIVHLPYSSQPTDDYPNDIYLYSNYNFTDVKRELEVFSPLPDTDFTINDRSSAMTGSSFPPGLRFPTGAILGTHFIIAGTYLAHTYQSFSIWALDLLTMTWSRIDPGSAVSSGSWFRGCLWAEANKFLIFGNRNGNLVEDYNRRLLSWDHVAVIDLEAFGIYQPPTLSLDVPMQELGLSALEEGILTDFEIVCDDGRKIRCSRKVLEERWPWFKDQRKKFLEIAKLAAETLPGSPMHVSLPELPGVPKPGDERPDPRLTPRAFHLSEPYPITLALLQYFYSLALITPLQHAPAVLSQLLVLSSTYQITHLELLVKHAMHRALSNATSVGVYEVATLCSCRSLQIRALKTVMSYSQKRPSGRSRQDRDGGSGSRHPDAGGSSSGGGENSSTARPRGTSDAHFRGPPDQHGSGASTSRGYMANNSMLSGEEPSTPRSASLEATLSTSRSRSGHKPTPLELGIHRTSFTTMHSRNYSAVSTNTDSELVAVAELMSPAVVASFDHCAEEQERSGIALDDEEFDSLIAGYAQDRPETPRKTVVSIPHLYAPLSAAYPPHSPLPHSPLSNSASIYSDSELEQSSDDHFDRAYPPTPTSYPAFHLPRPRRSYNRDSVTPSLTSSSSASSTNLSQSRSSPPSSPTMLSTPVDATFASPHLAIIEERSPDEQEIPYPYRASVGSTNSTDITFAPMGDSPSSAPYDSQVTLKASSRSKKRVPHLETLRLETTSPLASASRSRSPGASSDSGSMMQPLSAPIVTSTLRQKRMPHVDNLKITSRASSDNLRSRNSAMSSSSGTASPLPRTPITPQTAPIPRVSSSVSLSRFLSPKNEKARAKAAKMSSGVSSKSQTDLASALSLNLDPLDAKARKAEEKRGKKAEMERLAADLRDRRKQRAEADKRSIHSGKSGDRKRGQWEDPGAMYGGLGTVVL